MANAASWNPSDKSADLTLTGNAYYGDNSIATNTATSNWRSVRSTWSASSGKWILQGTYFSAGDASGNAAGTGVGFGWARGSASLSAMLGDNANSYAVVANELSNGVVSTRFNSADVFTFGGTLNPDTGTMFWVALDLDASPQRAWWRVISYFNSVNNDAGWRNFSGTAGDPTTPSSGTDISGLGGTIFAGGTLYFQTTASNIVLNMGGWPLLTDWVPYPSGYSSPDANYPYVMPSGVYTLTTNQPATVTISHNNMRAAITSNLGLGVNSLNYTNKLPANKKKIWAWVCDSVHQRNVYVATGLTDDLNATNMLEWRSSGATADLGGITLPAYGSGSVCYWAVDSGAERAWVSLDGSSWFGASGSSGNPFAGTNGIDLSGLITIADARPVILLNSDRYVAATFNAGKLEDDAITLSNGWEWLEGGGILRSRVMMA